MEQPSQLRLYAHICHHATRRSLSTSDHNVVLVRMYNPVLLARTTVIYHKSKRRQYT